MAKQFMPDSRGGMSLKTPQIIGTSQVHAYKLPSSSTNKLDKILSGGQPYLLLQRSKGGLGDVLMTLPTVRTLQQKYNAQIDYATDFEYWGGSLPKLFVGNPYVTRVIDHVIVNKGDYNAVVDLTCPCIAYEKPHVAPINRIDLFARHAGLSLPLKNPLPDYYVTDQERVWAQQWIEARGFSKYKLILLCPNSSTSRRDCSQQTLQHALARLVQTFSKTHRGVISLQSATIKSDVNWHLAGTAEFRDYGFRELGALMEHCDLVICQDSAPLHLAGALNIKTLALFGPTDPRARINYYPRAQAIWFRHELACSPCYWADCRMGLTCWAKIKEDHILEAAKNIITESPIAYPWLISFPGNVQATSIEAL